ncbi:MAG: K(+)-transporting ATPase subunit F [Actinomycetota bacterium]|nr:K(+)-transporting ATPase subunit F [Paenarthrobacter sp. PH39-S1]MDJ0356794.1 K(+)-transporting ATPase subunit F [Paenarthrobacter sp. PH39-S1]MDQ6739767.1 K(+)-transporting ATPase subunit F [Actinomycetota bacterium]
MSFDAVMWAVLTVAAIGLLGYLLAALIRPERW